jgi:hypothetical protein
MVLSLEVTFIHLQYMLLLLFFFKINYFPSFKILYYLIFICSHIVIIVHVLLSKFLFAKYCFLSLRFGLRSEEASSI